MSHKKDIAFELRSARARRQHWLEECEVARLAGDREAEKRAQSFVKEYEESIAQIERSQTSPGHD
jgi:hypothetical protein